MDAERAFYIIECLYEAITNELGADKAKEKLKAKYSLEFSEDELKWLNSGSAKEKAEKQEQVEEEFNEHISNIMDEYIEKTQGDYKKLAMIYDDVERKEEKFEGKYESFFEELKRELAYLVTKLVIYHEKTKL